MVTYLRYSLTLADVKLTRNGLSCLLLVVLISINQHDILTNSHNIQIGITTHTLRGCHFTMPLNRMDARAHTHAHTERERERERA